MKTSPSKLILVAAVVLGGCASPFDDSPYTDWTDRDPQTRRSSPGKTAHGSKTPGATESMAPADPIPDDAGPPHYVRLALERNPAIRAARQKVQRLTARIAQVTSLDDPYLTVAPLGEMAETAAGEAQLMTGVSQKLPFPGKLEARGRIAAQGVAIAAHELENVRLTVAGDTRRAFWSYYFATRGLEVIGAQRKLLEQFRQAAESKYKAGTATQQDVLRASVELASLDNRLITFGQRRSSAVAMLNSQLGRPVDADLPTPAPTSPGQITVRLDRLLAAAAAANPGLQQIHQRIGVYRQQLKLARLQRWPDLTVSANYNAVDHGGTAPSATGDDQWWIGFGMNLPIWAGKLDAAEREARHGIFEGVADLANQRNQVAFLVQDAAVKVETQQRLVTLFRDVIVPQARQTVRVSKSGYRAGKVDFLTIVDNWRKLLEFELMYHLSVSQLEQHFAELQRVVGRDLVRQPTAQDTPQSSTPAHHRSHATSEPKS